MELGDVIYEKRTVTSIKSIVSPRYYEDDVQYKVERVNAIEIPDNATNGDMIRALFPNPTENSQYTVGEDRVYSTPNGEMHYYSISKSMQFICSTDYWNAPYKLSEPKGENNE